MWFSRKKKAIESESVKSMLQSAKRVAGALRACKPAPREVPTIDTAIFLIEKQAEMLEHQQRLIEDQADAIESATIQVAALA